MYNLLMRVFYVFKQIKINNSTNNKIYYKYYKHLKSNKNYINKLKRKSKRIHMHIHYFKK